MSNWKSLVVSVSVVGCAGTSDTVLPPLPELEAVDGDGGSDVVPMDARLFRGVSGHGVEVDGGRDSLVDRGSGPRGMTWYADQDGDGYGNRLLRVWASEPPSGFVADATDCDDDAVDIHPGQDDWCDGVDQNCSGDETDALDVTHWHLDQDGDGYGSVVTEVLDCLQPSGLVSDGTDCDDADPQVYPGAEEQWNAVDDDCDGVVDEDFGDTDMDGVADADDSCPVYADPTLSVSGDGSPSSPYNSIADAIALRGAFCDQIVLMDGTFMETVDYGGADLQISSLNGPHYTTIEAPSGGTVVTIAAGESKAALLSGVRLRGGTGTPGDGVVTDAAYAHGGGLFVLHADPTIVDCVIEQNTVTGLGGGVYMYDYDGVFQHNVVQGNVSQDIPDGGGGGVFVSSSDGILDGNIIKNNAAYGWSGDGGGITILFGQVLFTGNRVEGNFTTTTGGGVRTASSQTEIFNNLIIDNMPDGIAVSYDDSGPIVNNTIADNGSYGIYSFTCCGYVGAGPTIEVVNNLITGSSRHGLKVVADNAFTTWSHNDVYGPGSSGYSGYSDPTGTDGNIAVDPRYVGAGNYLLQSGSPAVDAGLDAGSYGLMDDINGQTRPLGGGWDMGALESH